jgi:DNA primase
LPNRKLFICFAVSKTDKSFFMDIMDIKGQLTINHVLAHYHLVPDKNHRLCCPFHEDSTPSLQVYPQTNTCYCFSSNCKTHAKAIDQIDFIMHKEGCSKHEAILKAQHLLQEQPSPDPTPAPVSSAATPVDYASLLRTFVSSFKKSPAAQEYARKRLLNPTIGIGYNAGAWGELKHCLIFPLLNHQGQPVSLYGRSIYDKTGSRHFYSKDRHGLYPSYPASYKKRLILTESIIDAATLLQIEDIATHYGLLALYGTNGLTEEHLAAIAGLTGLEEIILWLNADDAGQKATQKHAYALRDLYPHLRITYVTMPQGEDINSMAQGHSDPKLFIDLLDQRTDFLFSIESSTEKKEPLQLSISAATAPPLTPATPLPAPTPKLDTANPYKLRYATTIAVYYIQGGISKALDSMKVTLVIEHPQSHQKSRSKVDLYEDKQVEKTSKDAGDKLQLRADLLESDLHYLTDLLDTYREAQQEAVSGSPLHETYPPTVEELRALTTFCQRPDLLEGIGELLGQSGIVGEENSRLFIFLIALSHLTQDPLHVLIQGSSGSGKTRLLRQISDCMPASQVVRLTRVSDKSFYNYPENFLRNKLVCLEDVDGLSEEAEYAYRELVSNGELISSIAVKDDSGRITSGQKIVRGPIASMACTTNGRMYEDNISRMLIVAVDESAAQTRRVVDYQNSRAAGAVREPEEQKAKRFLQQFTASLKPWPVVNPYAARILLPEGVHKLRRLNDLFQLFIRLVTLLHQHQRKKDAQGRLVCTPADVERAVGIMFDSIVLKSDELDGSLRQFYEQLKVHAKANNTAMPAKPYTFSAREIRHSLSISKSQLHRYLQELVSLEYLAESGFHNRGYQYRIQYWDDYKALRDKIKTHLSTQLSAL